MYVSVIFLRTLAWSLVVCPLPYYLGLVYCQPQIDRFGRTSQPNKNSKILVSVVIRLFFSYIPSHGATGHLPVLDVPMASPYHRSAGSQSVMAPPSAPTGGGVSEEEQVIWVRREPAGPSGMVPRQTAAPKHPVTPSLPQSGQHPATPLPCASAYTPVGIGTSSGSNALPHSAWLNTARLVCRTGSRNSSGRHLRTDRMELTG